MTEPKRPGPGDVPLVVGGVVPDCYDGPEPTSGGVCEAYRDLTLEFVRVAGQRDKLAAVVRNLLGNASCRCDHPLRAGYPPCSKCEAEAALAVLDADTKEHDLSPEAMGSVQRGLADMKAGRLTPADEVFALDADTQPEEKP